MSKRYPFFRVVLLICLLLYLLLSYCRTIKGNLTPLFFDGNSSAETLPEIRKEASLVQKNPYEGEPFSADEIYVASEGTWTSPRIVPFPEKLNCYNPVFSLDGNKIYFFAALSMENAGESVPNICVTERKGEVWTEAVNNVSHDGKWFFFVIGRSGNVDVYWVDAKAIGKQRPKDLK
jgi:hypothetical protein